MMFRRFLYIREKQSVFLKFFLSYIIVCTIPLLILGATGYFRTRDIVLEQSRQTYISAITDVRKNMDENIDSLNKFAVQISQMPWVIRLMYLSGNTISYDHVSTSMFLDRITELSTFNAVDEFVDDIAIYFNDKDTIISNRGKDTLLSFFLDVFNYENMTATQFEQILSQRNVLNFILPTKVNTFGKPRKLITYIQSLPPSDKNFKATLMIFIDENTLINALETTTLSKNVSLYVMDANNNYITGLNTVDIIKPYLANLKFEKHSNTLIDNFTFADQDKYHIFYSISPITGWKYIAVTPLKNIMYKVNYLRTVTLVIAVISLIIGLFLSYRLALQNYRPLADLIRTIRIRLMPDSQPVFDEYIFLEKALNTILEYREQAADEIKLYKPLVENACLMILLKDGFKKENNFEKLLGVLNVVLDNTYFTCVAVYLAENRNLAEAFKDDIRKESALYNTSIYFVEMDGKNKMIILNTVNEQEVKHLVSKIKDSLLNTDFHYKVIGVGKTYNSINNLWQSYSEAVIAVDYRFIKGNGCIIFFDKLDRSSSSSYYYPIEKEEYIINYVKTGNYEQAIYLCKTIIEENMDKRQLTPNTVRYLLYTIATTAFKAIEDIDTSGHIIVRLDDLLYIDTIEQMIMYIEKLYQHVCDIVKKEKESHNTYLRDKVLDYINTYYYDNNLSLTRLARTFDVSPAYLSRFIKNQTGYNFVDYLNKYRIEASKQQLLLEDATILQVAKKVGFDNDATFRRLFKKFEGITPVQYKNTNSVQFISRIT